jgi:hypothetical protein
MLVQRMIRGTIVVMFLASASSFSFAQSNERRFEAAGQVALAASDQFDGTDTGVGGRLTWKPLELLGFDAEVNYFPGDYPDDGAAFSSARWEGFFGGTIGPQLGRMRPFAKIRPGFVTYREAPEPFACILIYPPPLNCTLASGGSVFALDWGGGVDVSVTARTVIRLDVGDRLLRYQGPVLGVDRTVQDEAFWSHGFRFAAGAGIRF